MTLLCNVSGRRGLAGTALAAGALLVGWVAPIAATAAPGLTSPGVSSPGVTSASTGPIVSAGSSRSAILARLCDRVHCPANVLGAGGVKAAGLGPAGAVHAAGTEAGYDLVAADGGIFSYGTSFYGSTGATPLNQSIVGMASTPDGAGYYLVAKDGGIFAYGDGAFQGSTGGTPLNQPIVGMAVDPATGGYWLVASDGGIFAFDAPFYGSTGGTALNQPIVGMASTPDGGGYYLVAKDGGIFAYGDATFQGSTGGTALNRPIVGMAVDPATGGYWLVASDGGIFAFDAPFYGSTGGTALNQPIVGMASTPDGAGYYLVAKDGGIFAYGDATFQGSTGGTALAQPIVGMTVPLPPPPVTTPPPPPPNGGTPPPPPTPMLKIIAGQAGQMGVATPGPATASALDAPDGVAVDSAGDVYIADSGNDLVEKVTPAGVLSIVAGVPNFAGPTVPGPALDSYLDDPESVAVDGSGNVYIADAGNSVVEKVTPAGTLSVVAGLPEDLGVPVPGPATASPIGIPEGLAVDSAGDLFIADIAADVIEEVTPGGTLSIAAGTAGEGTLVPGPGVADQSPLGFPVGVAVDSSGDLYIADLVGVVEKVDAEGEMSILAGIPGISGLPTAGPASHSALGSPFGVAVDGQGNVYIADNAYSAVEEVSPAGTLSIAVGKLAEPIVPSDGPLAGTGLEGPAGLAVDGQGDLYISDDEANVIEEVTPS